jgi:glycosyltransferase involved in cell wall biosynthesis
MYPRDLPLVRRVLYRTADPFLFIGARQLPRSTWTEPLPGPLLSDSRTISIVTPSFNQAQFLERTLASVVGQRYPSLEYIVQDGGSTDGSVAILKRWGERLRCWESRPDAGQSAAINAGFRRSTGEIMAYLNSDDVLMPGALATVSRFMAAHPDVDAVYSHGLMIDEYDRPAVLLLLPEHDDRALRWYDYVPQMTLFWRRSLWEKSGGTIDESLQYAMDWDLLQRFIDARARFARLPTLLGGFRLHHAQKTQTIRAVGSYEVDALRTRHLKHRVSFSEVALNASPHLLSRARVVLAYRLGLQRLEIPWEATSAFPDESDQPARVAVSR